MRTRTKVILDDWFGKSAVFCLNITARILGKILSIDHSMTQVPGRIVVCKFLGMGSIIQSTPLLQTLRLNFPSAEIIFITSRVNRKLLESIDVVDRILTIDDSGFFSVMVSTFSVLKSLWKKRAGLYIDLETYSYYSTALATLSCARNRVGFYRVERNIRMGVYTHMMFFNSRAPIAQSYLQMARLAGCKNIVEKLYRFNVPGEDLLSCKQKLFSKTGKEISEYIIINPNASDLRVERRWPPENFISLIKNLRSAYPGKTMLLIGAGSESAWVESIVEKLDETTKEKVVNTAGIFSLTELFALIGNCTLVISNDTGPMHVSFALGKPTISLFGPASPSQYGQNQNAYGVYKNIYCSPCVHDFLTPPCRGDNQCMKQITVNEVETLCRNILSGSGKPEFAETSPMNYLKSDGQTSLGIINRGK